MALPYLERRESSNRGGFKVVIPDMGYLFYVIKEGHGGSLGRTIFPDEPVIREVDFAVRQEKKCKIITATVEPTSEKVIRESISEVNRLMRQEYPAAELLSNGAILLPPTNTEIFISRDPESAIPEGIRISTSMYPNIKMGKFTVNIISFSRFIEFYVNAFYKVNKLKSPNSQLTLIPEALIATERVD